MFLDENYLLENAAAKTIFASIKDLPVVDAHNHADVKSLMKNECYSDMWQLFAATDHYVWETMRKCGVSEEYITGSASNHDKFMKLAEVFPLIAGNPVYEWIHLDLRFLGIELVLDASTGEEIWAKGNEILAKESSRPLALLKRLNVEVMCSTDDPADLLEEHASVNSQAGTLLVRPTWRPDKAMKIFAADWKDYIAKLGKRFDTEIKSFDSLLECLKKSHDYFDSRNCRASDHGLEIAVGAGADEKLAAKTFKKALKGKKLSTDEINNFMGVLMLKFGEWNSKTNWVTQLHLGAVRDVRHSLYDALGPDVGGDISYFYQDQLPGILAFLNHLDDKAKVVLYCLDPSQQATLATVSRAFGSKVRLGSAWWLLDTPVGMKRQLEYIGSVDVYSVFAGMVSDSRKLLSYGSRFEMFRRVLSSVLGAMVEKGQMPESVALNLAKIMAYDGPKGFFNL